MIEITEDKRAWAIYEQEQRYLRAEITRKRHEEELWTNFQDADAECKRVKEAYKQEVADRQRAEPAHQLPEAERQDVEDEILRLKAQLAAKDKRE